MENEQVTTGSTFEGELAALINRHSLENGSGTPDFLLAAYLQGCLSNWNKCVVERDRWHGFESSVTASRVCAQEP